MTTTFGHSLFLLSRFPGKEVFKSFKGLFFLLYLISSFSLSAQHLDQPDETESVHKPFSSALDSLRKVHHIPGLAAAIVKDNKLVWSEGIGMSHFDTDDGEKFKEVSADTPFWIASVTKPIVALLFLQLEAQGKINLDDPITDMPGWDSFCSGLRNSGSIFGKDLNCNISISVRNVLNHTVQGKPGSRFSYNPVMYSRLSRYLEYVYGNPISAAESGHNTMAKLMERNILKPAGMDRTMASQWQREKAEVYFDKAQGYAFSNGKYTPRHLHERHLAGGAGVVSTVNDLAKFDMALNAGSLGSKSLISKFFAPALDPEGNNLPYAFGWYVQEYKGEQLIWHSGWDRQAGASALYLKVPERKLTFIILANSEGLWWGNPLHKAEVENSEFAQLFLHHFVFSGTEN